MPRKETLRDGTFWSVPFVICLIVLGVTAACLGPVTRYMKVTLAKEAIALRSSLARMDKSRLGPYRFYHQNTLESAVVDTLGTEEYIDWVLEDTTLVGTKSPLRFAHLFVTYYTGEPDAVPHTPDHCYRGSGYTPESAKNTTLHIATLTGAPDIPVRTLHFVKSALFDADKIPVVYTFHCNGRFVATANGVRAAANNPLDKYAYFSKVELTFGWENAHPHYPSWENAIAASERLFQHVLPLLVEEHWPDWQAVKDSEAQNAEDG